MSDESHYDWQPFTLILPRIGLFLDRFGVRTRLLLPGPYLVRESRTMRRRIYRRHHAHEWGD